MANNSIDILSNLPDSIIDHILSLLDTKLVVQTSVLSKQWKCTWKQVSVLRFHSPSFGSYLNFKRYVNKVLSLRSPLTLREVYLIDREESNLREASLFVKVIEYAFSHHAQHLTVDLWNGGTWDDAEYSFSDLFGSTIPHHSNLKSLELGMLILDVGFRSSGFLMLKVLNLSLPVFTSEHEVVFDYFSEFPCLEDLTFDGVHCIESDHAQIFKISGLRLRTLDLSYNQFDTVAIDAPNLKSFTFHNVLEFVEFTELNLSSLDHADICIDKHHCPVEEYIDYADYFIDFFTQLSNVTSLTLRPSTLTILSCICECLKEEPSPFTRLKTLTLDPEEDEGIPFGVIDYFARGSDMNPVIKYVC
ncbi:Putative F-box/LRR-repeat protein At3g18150 [Linum grandiflorum]